MTGMKRLLSALALAAFVAAMVVIAVASLTSGDGSTSPTTGVLPTIAPTTQPATTAAPPPPKPVSVQLVAVGAYDPEGDGRENDSLAPLAVDGDPSTYWKTEHYSSFSKKGVGLVLDAGRNRTLVRVVVSTDGSGSSAQILLGTDPAGPFRAVSADRPLRGSTAFPLRKGSTGRYLVVWITSLPQAIGEAHVTEVRAFAQGR